MSKKITDIESGLVPDDPEWVSLTVAGTIIEAAGYNADRFFRVCILGSDRIAWRAKTGEQGDDGELESLQGIEIDARGLRQALTGSKGLH